MSKRSPSNGQGRGHTRETGELGRAGGDLATGEGTGTWDVGRGTWKGRRGRKPGQWEGSRQGWACKARALSDSFCLPPIAPAPGPAAFSLAFDPPPHHLRHTPPLHASTERALSTREKVHRALTPRVASSQRPQRSNHPSAHSTDLFPTRARATRQTRSPASCSHRVSSSLASTLRPPPSSVGCPHATNLGVS